jgi:hypothetical protein
MIMNLNKNSYLIANSNILEEEKIDEIENKYVA